MNKNRATKQEIYNMVSNLEHLIKSLPEFNTYGNPQHKAFMACIQVIKRDDILTDTDVNIYLDEEVYDDVCGEDDELYISNYAFDALDWKMGTISSEDFLKIDI